MGGVRRVKAGASVRVSIVKKRCYGHGNSYKKKYLTEVAVYSSEVQSINVMAESIETYR